jgi:hypothetical protein
MRSDPKHLWFDWFFLVTVGLFSGAIVATVLDTIFLYKFTRIVAACIGGGVCGLVAMSIAEDINIEFRCARKGDKNGKQKNS